MIHITVYDTFSLIYYKDLKVAFDVSKCFKRKILSSRSFGLRREVQFPDFVLTQFLCFGTNFVAFCIDHNKKPFCTSESTYLLPSEGKLGVIQQLRGPNLPNFYHLPPSSALEWTIVDILDTSHPLFT